MNKNLAIMGVYEIDRYLDPLKLYNAMVKGIIDLDILINVL
jgi:hypothetical protein